eukprot:gb/GECH01010221.1/.p1 GENE.gb/GECH01010221.1/~~gb/GECH01010221.1/.p1  ORF type:complete len:148 (+),score=41.83 gb/GECH01010221.1/:1-444(+)
MGHTKLHNAAMSGDAHATRLMIDQGYNVNAKDRLDPTPLHWACLEGHILVVIELLKSPDIQVNVKAQWGNTPLHWACLKGNLSIVEELLRAKKIDLHLKNMGEEPIDIALKNKFQTIQRILEEYEECPMYFQHRNFYRDLHDLWNNK